MNVWAGSIMTYDVCNLNLGICLIATIRAARRLVNIRCLYTVVIVGRLEGRKGVVCWLIVLIKSCRRKSTTKQGLLIKKNLLFSDKNKPASNHRGGMRKSTWRGTTGGWMPAGSICCFPPTKKKNIKPKPWFSQGIGECLCLISGRYHFLFGDGEWHT